MTQRGAWDVASLYHLTESAFGTTLTAGTWLPIALLKSFEPRYMPQFKPKTGIGRQNPSDWVIVKDYYEFDIEVELIKYEAAPNAYDWARFMRYILEKSSGEDGTPGNTLDSFSLVAKLDLDTDEYWWLKGCMLDRVDVIGSSVDDLVTARMHGIGQSGDYGTTDAVSGTATRQSLPAVMAQIPYGECDILYDPTSPSTIMDDVSSFRLSLIRNLEKRGTDATTKTLYRDFVPTTRRWEVEIMKDFDSKTELEHFVDATKTKITFEIPNAVAGTVFSLTSGYWNSPSGVPVRELDLLNLRLVGEFGELAVTSHGA